MVADVRAKGEPVKDEGAVELIALANRDALELDALFLALEGDGDPADGARRLRCSRCRTSCPSRRCKTWPNWAQRHIVLGLDLQGGSHILLEVDSDAVRKEKVEPLRDDVRRVLRESRVG